MQKLPLLSIPYPTNAATLAPQNAGLVLRMNCSDDNGVQKIVDLLFVKPRAFRQRAETYCTGWHVKDVFDILCEIEQSDWVSELKGDAVPEWKDYWVMRHFMIFVDGFGCIEVIAESVEMNEDNIKNSEGT